MITRSARRPGWRTAVDLDFAALANQALATDGTHTIGGITATKVNSAKDYAAMSIVAGAGLRQTPVQTTDYYFGDRTAPGMRFGALDLVPSLAQDQPIRFWAAIGAANLTAANDQAILSLERTDAATFSAAKVGVGASGAYLAGAGALAGTNLGIAGDGTAAHRVLMIELPNGLLGGCRFVLRSGALGDGATWPAESALVQVADGSMVVASFAAASMAMWGVRLAAARNGSVTALVVDWRRLRVDVWQ